MCTTVIRLIFNIQLYRGVLQVFTGLCMHAKGYSGEENCHNTMQSNFKWRSDFYSTHPVLVIQEQCQFCCRFIETEESYWYMCWWSWHIEVYWVTCLEICGKCSEKGCCEVD